MPITINSNAISVVADIPGLSLSADDEVFLRQPEISGIILFARNYASPEQLKALTASISALRPDLLICVDQEGGRVQRFKQGFSILPPMLTLEAAYQANPAQGLAEAQKLGYLMASEVRAHGVHLSFAPVLDIHYARSVVIGDRAFGSDAETVVALADAFIQGMHYAGMHAVGKHFPGHGGVEADSHFDLPVDKRSLEELSADIEPFKMLINEHALSGIMPAHVLYPEVDSHNAGFSAYWLQDILRQQCGFNGVIFSDDLTMAAADIGTYAERTQAAVAAGGNAILVCNQRDAAQAVVAEVRRLQQAGAPHLSLEGLIHYRDGAH